MKIRYTNFANQEYMKKNLTLIDLLGQNERGEIPLIWKNSSNVNKDSRLITPMELRTLKMFEAIVILHKLMPYKITLIPDYKIKWENDYKDSNLLERELPEIKFFSN